MAEKLGRQFRALDSISEIHQALLSASNENEIIDIAIGKINSVIPADSVSFARLDPLDSAKATIHERKSDTRDGNHVFECAMSSTELKRLKLSPSLIRLTDKDDAMPFLTFQREQGYGHSLLFPVAIKTRISGVLSLG